MTSQTNEELVDSYRDLIEDFNIKHVSDFLQACWLFDAELTLKSVSLERIIYHDGDAQEVYTAQERKHIDSVEENIIVGKFDEEAVEKAVPCRVIAINIDYSSDKLLDSLALMKIINKAFDSFNVFLFVTELGVAFGCSCIKNSSIGQDCVISPLITSDINWDCLYEVLLYRSEAQDFYGFYSGIISTILSVKACFDLHKENDHSGACDYYAYDDTIDYYEDARQIDFSSLIECGNATPLDSSYEGFSADAFSKEVDSCMSELEYIKSSHQNSLEVLFEAQQTLETAHNQPINTSTSTTPSVHINTEHFAMLDDPVALLKILKQRQSTDS